MTEEEAVEQAASEKEIEVFFPCVQENDEEVVTSQKKSHEQQDVISLDDESINLRQSGWKLSWVVFHKVFSMNLSNVEDVSLDDSDYSSDSYIRSCPTEGSSPTLRDQILLST